MLEEIKAFSTLFPPEIVKTIERIAREENKTLPELLEEAVRQYISRKRWQKIRNWGAETAKQLGIKTDEDVERLIDEVREEA